MKRCCFLVCAGLVLAFLIAGCSRNGLKTTDRTHRLSCHHDAPDKGCAEQMRKPLNIKDRTICGECWSGYRDTKGVCVKYRNDQYRGPFVAGIQYLQAWNGQQYEDLFLKGINLGLGMPGTRPGDLAPSRSDYSRWFAQMSRMGFNTLRIYTLHFPRFYEALAEYNRRHAQNALYLIQGVWLSEENPSGTLDLHALSQPFDAEIERVIDSAHGNAHIKPRAGRGFGQYKADVSPWVIGWLIGREIFAHEVLETDKKHPQATSFQGRHLRLPTGNPSSVWAAARLDHAIAYEHSRYETVRPVGFSNWLELDPLNHPTEPSSTLSDAATIDLSGMDPFNAPAGYFASFHVYPYYPLFISEDPVYRTYSDAWGPNSYYGYLEDLKRHYARVPLIVAEFGVPTSWGNAKFSYSGMHHGGHSERQQGVYAARMLNNIYTNGYAGAIYFAWMDGWFKRIWIINPLIAAPERLPLWHDMTNPQQHYGLLAFDVGPPDYTRWPPVKASGRILEVKAAANAEFFNLFVTLKEGLSDGERMVVGFDTYRDDLGESRLPGGATTSLRSELALIIQAPDDARLYVTKPYDLYGKFYGLKLDGRRHRSIASDGGEWVAVKWKNSRPHGSDDGRYAFPGTEDPIGRLVVRRRNASPGSLDAVVLDARSVEIRIPWILLQFSDPSTRSVIHDDLTTPALETAVSGGIAAAVALDGELVETSRFSWNPWDQAPAYREREKASVEIFSRALLALPDKHEKEHIQ